MNEVASKEASTKSSMSKEDFKNTVLEDYKLANISRETSLLGRREVLTGKAKFGIFGDGKEVPQLAMARFFQNGDFRSGYYRDQTFMMAIGALTVEGFFAQLYAHPNIENDPASGGRSMNGHFATRSLDENGEWKALSEMKNSSADISPTSGQMPRLLGLAQASKVYRNNELLKDWTNFSKDGNEVAFGTIGDSSTSEGLFWETINAAGVLQVPMLISVWDDGHGISVPKKYQTTKENISEVLKGFQRDKGKQNGYEIFKVKGWDYAALMETYEKAANIARDEHCPVLVHVEELTQPQGHSTSGSHERYKSKERLDWEQEYDCIAQLGKWIINKGLATELELKEIQQDAKKVARQGKKAAWDAFVAEVMTEKAAALEILLKMQNELGEQDYLITAIKELKNLNEPLRKDLMHIVRSVIRKSRKEEINSRNRLIEWVKDIGNQYSKIFSSKLYSESKNSPLELEGIPPTYDEDTKEVDGRVVLRDNFDKLLERYPEMLIFGEDSGKIGDVNQGLEGLQEKYGELRVSDTGIREATIAGQGIGMSMRGLRPVAEIQYLDYLLYALQIMSDDLATVHYRSAGGQKAPLIVRTRGHRLEGIWHSGSPMGVVINALRGIHVCVPRNLTDAAAFYNTLMKGDDPALIIEPLNAYRSKEKMPNNLGEFRLELGVPEIVKEGNDLTIVSYGSTCNIAEQSLAELEELGISAELIDVKTLLPFDKHHMIVESLKKTNKLLVVDEDVSGAASAYILQQVLEKQMGYYHLDVEPKTLNAKDHRAAYGTDGDYFSKPSIDDIVEMAYQLMRDIDPERYPALY